MTHAEPLLYTEWAMRGDSSHRSCYILVIFHWIFGCISMLSNKFRWLARQQANKHTIQPNKVKWFVCLYFLYVHLLFLCHCRKWIISSLFLLWWNSQNLYRKAWWNYRVYLLYCISCALFFPFFPCGAFLHSTLNTQSQSTGCREASDSPPDLLWKCTAVPDPCSEAADLHSMECK